MKGTIGEPSKSHHARYARWTGAILFVLGLVCLAAQLPNVASLTPTYDSQPMLSPLTNPSSPPTHKKTFLSKAERQHSRDEIRYYGADPPHIQQCLDAERPTSQAKPAISTWVQTLDFHYLGYAFDESEFHQDNVLVAQQILAARGNSPTNFVLAQISVITNTNLGRHIYPLPALFPGPFQRENCFRSGQGIVPNVGRLCHGWDVLFGAGNAHVYNNYLRNVVGIPNPNPQAHYHSEQALLAYLYQDSVECSTNGLMSPGCRLGRGLVAAQVYGLEYCTIDAFTLDIISIPNSVCPGCDRALQRADWLSGYSDALNTYCANVPNPRNPITQGLQVMTSSLEVYDQFGHISCLGINHPQHVPALTNEGITRIDVFHQVIPTGTVLHKIPLDPNTARPPNPPNPLQNRCAQVAHPGCQ